MTQVIPVDPFGDSHDPLKNTTGPKQNLDSNFISPNAVECFGGFGLSQWFWYCSQTCCEDPTSREKRCIQPMQGFKILVPIWSWIWNRCSTLALRGTGLEPAATIIYQSLSSMVLLHGNTQHHLYNFRGKYYRTKKLFTIQNWEYFKDNRQRPTL